MDVYVPITNDVDAVIAGGTEIIGQGIGRESRATGQSWRLTRVS